MNILFEQYTNIRWRIKWNDLNDYDEINEEFIIDDYTIIMWFYRDVNPKNILGKYNTDIYQLVILDKDSRFNCGILITCNVVIMEEIEEDIPY